MTQEKRFDALSQGLLLLLHGELMPRSSLLFRQTFRAFKCSRPYATIPARWRPLPVLPDNTLITFQTHAFEPAIPYLVPRNTFANIPAIEKWFAKHPTDSRVLALNQEYLKQYGDTMLPLEYTKTPDPATSSTTEVASTHPSFQRGPAPFSLFLSWVALATTKSTSPISSRLYLAQAPLSALPEALHQDIPTPDIVLQAGKGDIYDSSLWLGVAPTYTPLHRDPNPNLFVQLAGRKTVRLLAPDTGEGVYERVKRAVGGQGDGKGVIRGEEMMKGKEREVLEDLVWGKRDVGEDGWEAVVEGGDGVFIPQGWWHSLKGPGEGVTGSVNWWFR